MSLYSSGSTCSLSAGLEAMGLSDIRQVVRLMCLSAAGQVDSPAAAVPRKGSSAELASGSVCQGSGKGQASLTYLSAAIGALARENQGAASLLVQLCAQVGSYISD